MRSKTLFVVSLLCMSIAGLQADEDLSAPSLTTKVDLGYVSKYIWRGIPQTPGAAFQPSLTVLHNSGLSANFWASRDADAGEFKEHDYTLNYAWTRGGVGLNAGAIYYAFPNTSYASTSEIYASVGFPGKFSPTVSVNWDVDEARGMYASAGIGYCCKISRGQQTPAVNLGAKLSFSTAGYNRFWFGVDEATVSDFCLSASMPLTIGKGSLTPALTYATVIDRTLRDSLAGSGLDEDNVIASLTYSCAL